MNQVVVSIKCLSVCRNSLKAEEIEYVFFQMYSLIPQVFELLVCLNCQKYRSLADMQNHLCMSCYFQP